METIWGNTGLEERDKLKGTLRADCVVIGAGMAGLMIAYELQKRGFGVVLLEADRVCSGATARTTAKITAQHGLIYSRLVRQHGADAAKLYYESNSRGIDIYEKIIRDKEIDCNFSRVPSYVYARDNVYDIIEETFAAYKVGAKFAYTAQTELPFPVKGALRFDMQGQFHPMKFACALAKELKIYEKSPVVDVEDGRVRTKEGQVLTNYIVNTTHYPIMDVPGFYFMRQHQERSYAIALRTEHRIEGMYYSAEDDRSLRGYEGGIIIGGESHRTGNNLRGGCRCRLRDFAQKYYPEAQMVMEWSNQDVMTHDGIPFIGRYSVFSPRIFVATGFNKWGMSLSAVASQLISDLICDRKNDYEKLYSPYRVKLRAAARSFLTDVGYSVRGLASGLVTDKKHRCSHMGCALRYNPDEKSWECPCHGSQFDTQGKNIFTPANRNLPG